MKNIILTLFVFSAGFLISQSKASDIYVVILPLPTIDEITMNIHSKSGPVTDLRVKIVDDKGTVAKTVKIAGPVSNESTKIPVRELNPGHYTCVVYQGKTEVGKSEFFKDAIMIEPQKEPVGNPASK